MDFLYDVAISFLSGDEPLARSLYDALSENLKVFVYSQKQEQIAGRDGLEVFREAFFSQSRMQVVLYRKGWGQTSGLQSRKSRSRIGFLTKDQDLCFL
jgi:hypothetical protein